MTTYCNINSDLQSVFGKIESYNTKKTLTGFVVSAGSVYKKTDSGYIEMVLQDGAQLTAVSNTSPSAGEFYYHEDTNTLYLHTTGSVVPNTVTIQGAVDWDAFKTKCRNDAQELLEGLLAKVFAVPFQKIPDPAVSYNSRNYDYWVRRATALLTCFIIVDRMANDTNTAQNLYMQVDNPKDNDFDNELPLGIVQRIVNGDITLKTQRTARETGGWNVYETLNSNSTGVIELTGHYVGSYEEIWRIHMDTAGVPGTATFKLSTDGGTTFDKTLQVTRTANSDNQRVLIADGVYVRFSGTFVLNDYFDIRLFPDSDRVSVASITNQRLTRRW